MKDPCPQSCTLSYASTTLVPASRVRVGASPARVHPALPAARAAQRFPPYPPLRALCQWQPRREHRDGPCTPQCRLACRRPAAGCRAGCATGAALLVPALWRSHDRHRGLRTRLRAKVATGAQQDRHVMSQTRERCAFQVPMRWPNASDNLSRPHHIDQCSDWPLMRSKRPPKCQFRLPNSPAFKHAGRLALASRPPSSQALTSNPHSTRC